MSLRSRSVKSELTVVRTPLRWETTTAADRTDLRCTVCKRMIAYGVHADVGAEEAAFFVQAHQPFCLTVG